MTYLATRVALGLALHAEHLVLDGLRVNLEAALVGDLHLPPPVALALGEHLVGRTVVRLARVAPEPVSKFLGLHRHLFELVISKPFYVHALQHLLQLLHVGRQGLDVFITMRVVSRTCDARGRRAHRRWCCGRRHGVPFVFIMVTIDRI